MSAEDAPMGNSRFIVARTDELVSLCALQALLMNAIKPKTKNRTILIFRS